MFRSSYCFLGLPFSGKSLLGNWISYNKNKGFIDTDHIIRYKFNKDLQSTIETIGANNFIKEENKILKTLHFENTIISPGGSSVYSTEGLNHLKRNLNCEIIHLYLSYDEFSKRAVDLDSRGVININNLDLKDLYDERKNLCNYYSNITINAINKKECFKELINIIE